MTASLVSLGSVMRGRSSSPPLLRLLRRIAAHLLMTGSMLYLRWVETWRNWADGPSRNKTMEQAAKEKKPLVRFDPLIELKTVQKGILIDGVRVPPRPQEQPPGLA